MTMVVFIVIHEFPDIYLEIDKAFDDNDKAHDYIVECVPHFTFKDVGDGCYRYVLDEPDLNLDEEECYYVIEKEVMS